MQKKIEIKKRNKLRYPYNFLKKKKREKKFNKRWVDGGIMFSFIWNHSFEIILSFPQLLEFPLISWEFHSRFCNSYNQITRREMLLCSVAQSCPTLVTPWTVACQATPSMEFSRQEYWSGLPFSPPGDLPNPGIKPMFLASPAMVGSFFTTESCGKPIKLL